MKISILVYHYNVQRSGRCVQIPCKFEEKCNRVLVPAGKDDMKLSNYNMPIDRGTDVSPFSAEFLANWQQGLIWEKSGSRSQQPRLQQQPRDFANFGHGIERPLQEPKVNGADDGSKELFYKLILNKIGAYIDSIISAKILIET